MSNGLHINFLPDWPYAGKPADGVIIAKETVEDGKTIAAVLVPARPIKDRAISNDEERFNQHEYTVENGYLIPHYRVNKDTRKRRDVEFLTDRVTRFFYSCEPGLDVPCTAKEMASELDLFDKKLAALNAQREAEGKPPFSLSMPLREMTDEERALVTHGKHITGLAVNRLGRLGTVILQRNREHVKIEYSDAEILEDLNAPIEYDRSGNMVAATRRVKDINGGMSLAPLPNIRKEFKDLWRRLTDDVHQSMVRCVLSRDGKPDHDGVYHHLIRELSKTVMPTLSGAPEPTGDAEEGTDHELVAYARQNVVAQIGNCLGAIDETALTLKHISQNKVFRAFLQQVETARQNPRNSFLPATKDLSLNDYTSELLELTEICRARACVKSDDHDNFQRLNNSLKTSLEKIKLHHTLMFKYAENNRNPHFIEALKLLKRGVALMDDMAQLRLPRNSSANGIYDKDTEEFQGRDASSVGRLKERVMKWVDKTAEIEARAQEKMASANELSSVMYGWANKVSAAPSPTKKTR